MRSLEFDRPFLLATNTGLTAFVDHRARVTSVAASHQATALRSVVEGRTGITPYAWWVARWGLWPLVFVGLGLLLVACFKRPGKAPRDRVISP
jgi:apolipoprotein N-acyltransferase